MSSPPRQHLRLALTGTGLALLLALGILVAQGVASERDRRALEGEQAVARALRLLDLARRSPDVMASVPSGFRFQLGDDGVLVDQEVGWIRTLPDAGSRDLVVDDRLGKLVLLETGGAPAAEIAAAFDALLEAPIGSRARLGVLLDAAWHARRAGLESRVTSLAESAAANLSLLAPADLAAPSTARAVASALRLEPDTARPFAARLGPFLPSALLAGSGAGEGSWRESQRERVVRRDLLRAADDAWIATSAAGDGALLAAGGTTAADAAGRFLWWLPSEDGVSEAAWLTARDWVDAVRDAGGTGRLGDWPSRAAPRFGIDPTQAGIAGIPGLEAVVVTPAAEGLQGLAWLPAIFTIVLFAVFVLVVFQEIRATRREALALAAQREFITNVTHELRTPLASIRLLAEMLAEGRALHRRDEHQRMLLAESTRLSSLIENVLDLGRAEQGGRALTIETTDLSTLVADTAAWLRPLLEADGRTIHVSAPEHVMASVDREAMVQALVAVIDNARKYGEGPVQVAIATSDGGATIRVTDAGEGVPAGERDRIFERFARGSRHQDGSRPGLGIGLYLSRALVRRMGGDLRCVDPGRERGARFEFRLVTETRP